MNLRIKRIQNGYSQKELGSKVKVSQQTIAKWEKGITTPSEFKQIRLLENLLNADARDLFPDLFDDSVLAE
ncbi:MAG: hypothetical protein CME82_11435 [Halomonas sp.]|nr:hypothetical protein [Halomonas sp.]|tara:strand:- start:16329 stop:16541 length:213 start_codon:yes stop_codon:yes gene_type:complete